MRISPVLLAVLSLLAGCRPAAPGGGVAPAPALAPRAEEPDALRGEAIADPVLREARERADAILGGLIGGMDDDDAGLSPVARKVKGYRSCSIKSQVVEREGMVEFRGVLDGPAGRARFEMTLVRQSGGGWAVATFSGPRPE